jgi:tetratricopeptide (TPR) repeat protein
MDASVAERKLTLLSLKQAYEKCALPKDSVYARMIHRLGDYFRIEGDFEAGIRLTQEAARINAQKQPGSQPSYLAHSYYNLGLYHNLLGLTHEAHSYYDSCIIAGYQFPEKLFIALMALEKKAFLYFQVGDYERSITVSDQGRALAQQQGFPDFEALLLIQKAQSESEINDVSQAEQNILRAIQILNDNDIPDYLPNAYSVYANVLSRRKQFREASLYYRRASEANLAKQKLDQAACDLHDLGFLYDKELHDPQRSIESYVEALKLLTKLKDPNMLSATYNNMLSSTYNNMGQVYLRQQDFPRACPCPFTSTILISNAIRTPAS